MKEGKIKLKIKYSCGCITHCNEENLNKYFNCNNHKRHKAQTIKEYIKISRKLNK